jgi:hypothetical protein
VADTTDQDAPAVSKADTATLEEMRERFDGAHDFWRDIRDESKTDRRFCAGDPWDDSDRKKRDDAGRPVITTDELSQYVNQLINEIRQSKRAIKVTPIGQGATDKTAERNANLIRQIEYRSNAQQSAYIPAFENCVQGSYGYIRMKPRYVSDDDERQELVIEGVPNPDMSLPDPDIQSPTGRDAKFWFLYEQWRRKDFKRRWPKARFVSFDAEQMTALQSTYVWGSEDKVTVAEYWTKEITKDELLLLESKDGQRQQFKVLRSKFDKSSDKASFTIVKVLRDVERSKVMQYFTNGLEILERTEWPAPDIPIASCFGKIIYVDDGGMSKRKILSAVRLARDPYMLLCYIRSAQQEIIGGTTRTSWIGYEGQFDAGAGGAADWQRAAHEPVAFLEAKGYTENYPQGNGNGPLPLPQKQSWDPPLQNLEIAAEAARRAIQAAIGWSPLPTNAQRQNEKSGVALEHIKSTGQQGSFHFIDHYEAMITRMGEILERSLPFWYDAQREETIRKNDDTTERVMLNDPSKPETDMSVGMHDVTLSTGPDFESERDRASQFADMLAGNPEIFKLIGPMIVRLKNLGPIGDQIAKALEILQPPELRQQEGKEPEVTPQMLQQAKATITELQQKLQQAADMIRTDQIKIKGDLEKTRVQGQIDVALRRMEDAAKVAVAKINAMTKGVIAQGEMENELIAQSIGQLHDHAIKAIDQAHEVGMAALNAPPEQAEAPIPGQAPAPAAAAAPVS